MLKRILLGLVAIIVVAVVAVLVLALRQPDTFRVERSVTVNAPAEKIVPHIADFRQWSAWSPWEHLDPAMQRSFTGAPAGKGSVYEWSGNSDVGQGRMEILDVAPDKVSIKLDFYKPMEASNIAEFALQPTGDTTDVTWAMYGPMPFISKVMCVFFDMDKMIGPDFEKGLAELKKVSEQ
ncbi:MAG TPA: SRPBCC family protein [Alphaproteobacteria bacterium]|nr:SRPBCC family protein [Alphaproteobacteria bacterium]